ncbi:MAG: rRNA methylase [Pseudomonadota bacterium]|jgi:23S rRNA (guanosine2251-2'-O)-methyltransferase
MSEKPKKPYRPARSRWSPQGSYQGGGRRPHFKAPAPEPDGPPQIFGIHAVDAALRNKQRIITALHLTENAETRLAEALKVRQEILGATPEIIRVIHPRELDRRLGSDTVHQGALAEVEELPEPSFKELARTAKGRPLLVLDQVTDPHNVGAILRSAAAFGAAGIVMTRRHSPPLHGALAKAASGALEIIPVALVQNLARALEDLKSAGFHIIGLEGTGDVQLEEMEWPERTALVMGAEGKGMRQLTKETAHAVAAISTDDALASLNVSNAAAIALHIGLLKRRGVLK